VALLDVKYIDERSDFVGVLGAQPRSRSRTRPARLRNVGTQLGERGHQTTNLSKRGSSAAVEKSGGDAVDVDTNAQ
jgi:hypothetical protein